MLAKCDVFVCLHSFNHVNIKDTLSVYVQCTTHVCFSKYELCKKKFMETAFISIHYTCMCRRWVSKQAMRLTQFSFKYTITHRKCYVVLKVCRDSLRLAMFFSSCILYTCIHMYMMHLEAIFRQKLRKIQHTQVKTD